MLFQQDIDAHIKAINTSFFFNLLTNLMNYMNYL